MSVKGAKEDEAGFERDEMWFGKEAQLPHEEDLADVKCRTTRLVNTLKICSREQGTCHCNWPMSSGVAESDIKDKMADWKMVGQCSVGQAADGQTPSRHEETAPKLRSRRYEVEADACTLVSDAPHLLHYRPWIRQSSRILYEKSPSFATG